MTRRFSTASRRWIYGLLLGLVLAVYWGATSLSQPPLSGKAAPRTTASVAAGANAATVRAAGLAPAATPAARLVAAEKPLVTSGTRQPAAAANLPLKRVVLFNSGVGFFEHSGQVEDNADVQLKFNVEDVNDLLKSMVVEDLGGGQISTVSYGSKDPISKTLKSFAVDLTTNPTLFDLLQQVRGERVELEVPNRISGLIVGVEKRKEKVGDRDTIDIDVLDLLTEAGLRAIKLETVTSIKLANEKLDSELRKALALLASSHDTDKKTVTLNFLGHGKRQVRVGYIQETPVWKTSYRLLVDDENPPLLQGWAIVENTTENDWSGVNLALVSGRPISFVMDLYQPLYVARPRVEMELYASLRPQSYEQDLAKREAEFRQRGPMAGGAATGDADGGDGWPTADDGASAAQGGRGGGQGLELGQRQRGGHLEPPAGRAVGGHGPRRGQPLPVHHPHARGPGPAAVGHVAHRQRKGQGREGLDLQRAGPSQAPPVRPETDQHHRLALDAGSDHGARRRRLRGRRQDRRPAARQPTADQLLDRPRHRGRAGEQALSRADSQRAAGEGRDATSIASSPRPTSSP